MILLDTFQSPMDVVIVGSSGGIGKALIEHLLNNDAVASIQGFCRSSCPIEHEKLTNHHIDVVDESSIIDAKSHLKPFDLLIIATGMLHQENVKPEKRVQDLNSDTLQAYFAINTIGPMLVAKHFHDHMKHENKSVIAFLSAKVGSIEDNALGGWYGYRSSKAALNMSMHNLSIEVQRFHPNSIVVGLHPGTVATNLSEPFSKNLDHSHIFSTDDAAEKLLTVINGLDQQHSGSVISHDGSVLPF